MPHIPLFNGERSRTFVEGYVTIGGSLLFPPVMFLVDPAAENSIITPRSEKALRRKNPELWEKLGFYQPDHSGVKPLHTIMGKAFVKALTFTAHGELAISLASSAGEFMKKRLDYLYFSEYPPKAQQKEFGKRRPGEDLSHSILGMDVLSNFSYISIHGNPGGRDSILTTEDHKLRVFLTANGFL